MTIVKWQIIKVTMDYCACLCKNIVVGYIQVVYASVIKCCYPETFGTFVSFIFPYFDYIFFCTVASRQLDKQTVGYLTWKWGMQSSMNATVMRDTSSNRFTGQIQLGLPNTFVLASYTQKFQGHDAQLTGTIK